MQLPEARRHEGCQIYAIHFMTPITENYTIDRWMHIRNTAIDDDQVAAQIDAMLKVAFDEDKAILEAIQAEEERAASPSTLRLAIDKGANVYRKRIDRLIEAESLQAAE